MKTVKSVKNKLFLKPTKEVVKIMERASDKDIYIEVVTTTCKIIGGSKR